MSAAKRTERRYPEALTDIMRDGRLCAKLAERLREADIWRLWPEVVGATIAARARPVRMIGGTLTVAVSSGPWKQELSFLKAMLIQKLNERLEGILVKDIVLKAGKVEDVVLEAPEEQHPRKKLTVRQKKRIDDLAAEIADPEIRAVFMELMTVNSEMT